MGHGVISSNVNHGLVKSHFIDRVYRKYIEIKIVNNSITSFGVLPPSSNSQALDSSELGRKSTMNPTVIKWYKPTETYGTSDRNCGFMK